jgi:hypothetical protein
MVRRVRPKSKSSTLLPGQPVIRALAIAVQGHPHLTPDGGAYVNAVAAGSHVTPEGLGRLFEILQRAAAEEVGSNGHV